MGKLKQQISNCYCQYCRSKQFYLILTLSGMVSLLFSFASFLSPRQNHVVFPHCQVNQISTVSFWTHVDRKCSTSLLNKFYKYPLILVGLKFSLAQLFVTCEIICYLGPPFFRPIRY